MKPFSILLSIVLGIVCLGAVVYLCKPQGATVAIAEPVASADDLPMPQSGPFGKAEIEEKTYDFGTRLVGTNDEHVFTIKNGGEGKLDFKMGKPTCQCTGVEIYKADGKIIEDGEGSLAPGESLSVLLKWQMKTRQETFRHGVKVFTTDPENRNIDLFVSGKINTAFFFRPEGLWDLGELSATEPSTAQGIIASPIFDDFTVEEEPRENPRVKVTFGPPAEQDLARSYAKSGYNVKVEVGPDVPVGVFRENIKLKAFKDDQQQEIEFVVAGRRSGPIEVRGVSTGATFNSISNRLIFQEFPAAQGKTVKMTVFVKGFDEDLALKGVEPADSRYKASLTPGKMLGKSKSYQLEIEIPPGPVGIHRGNDADSITLLLNHPEVPEFKMLIDYNAVR